MVGVLLRKESVVDDAPYLLTRSIPEYPPLGCHVDALADVSEVKKLMMLSWDIPTGALRV